MLLLEQAKYFFLYAKDKHKKLDYRLNLMDFLIIFDKIINYIQKLELLVNIVINSRVMIFMVY